MPDRSAIPYRFEPTASAASLQASHGDIEDGAETGVVVSIAGRLMLRRGQGKLVFGQLQDQTGRVQLFAPADVTPRFEQFKALSLGDWIGVTGEVMKTRKGELSVKVTDWVVLAEARRPFPDKWHGLTDPDTRYRQRYVDLWVNDDARRVFLLRSRLLSLTRRWLEDRGYLEVETPVFHPIPGGAVARPFTTHHNALDQELYLRIAPELYLKRLVVGGFERVFEVARVFRNEGLSPRHNPEFTMLELYEAYGDWDVHMALTEQLVAYLAAELCGGTTVTYQGRELDLSAPWRRASMSDLIEEQIGRRFDLSTPLAELRAACDELEVPWKEEQGAGKLLLELYEKTAEAAQWDPVFVTDYPQEVSPLARAHRELAGMTERFEAIVAGRELCNGFSELVDPDDQRARFEAQARQKDAGDDEAMAVDEDYLRALEYGLPPTVGLGIGIDRLVMLLADVGTIRDVILFPTLRPEQDRGVDAASDDGGEA
ncbi:MAG: lysyl-tRNA synthetase, class [Acidimicrobiales bacterium]|nr:lysyl-tRNA synthetase, class [Acidimicrobiales bacterium]